MMTRKERVMRALRYKAVDRMPVAGGFVRHPAFLADAAGVTAAKFREAPRQTAISAFKRLGVDVIIGLILPDPASATCSQFEHQKQDAFHSPEQVRDYAASLPPPEEASAAFDADAVATQYLQTVAGGQSECGDVLWLPNGIHFNCVVFDYCPRFGYENYVMALTLYPEVMERLFAYDAERAFLTNRAVADVTRKHNLVPIVWTGSDSCDNHGPFVKPELMDEIYFPHLRRALSPLREAGITIVWHSDGYITPIAASLLRAGVDGFQGLQEQIETRVAIADLDGLRTGSGQRPVFVGSVSSTVTLPFGTAQDVRSEVRQWLEFAAARGGGVLLNFSSSLGPEVPEENIFAFFEEGLHPAAARRRSIKQ